MSSRTLLISSVGAGGAAQAEDPAFLLFEIAPARLRLFVAARNAT
jgi:hypothetical protein